MEVKAKERKLIYYPIESENIIERNLDDFILFMNTQGHYERKTGKVWHFQNDICSFFAICNTTYMPDEGESGSDYPHIDSHSKEKQNLIKELVDAELITQKSSKTFYINEDLIDEDIIKTQNALHTIYLILHNKADIFSPLIHELKETCVYSQSMNKLFIAWHDNKFFPTATVDRLKEMGWEAFYKENKDNIIKKREYFNSLKK